MACTFYVLPARNTLGAHFAKFLNDIFPGMDWAQADQKELAETVTALAENRSDIFVVHRDDFLENADLETALVDGFGADKGDLVVEVGETLDSETNRAKLWRVTKECEIDIDDDFEDEDEEDTVASVYEE